MAETSHGDFLKTFLIFASIAMVAGVAVLLLMIYQPLLSILSYIFKTPSSLLVDPLFLTLVFPGLVYAGLVAYLAIWGERKFAAKVQNRVGPLYAGALPEGILQNIADLVKI